MKNKLIILLIPLLLTSCKGNNDVSEPESEDEKNYIIKEDTKINFLCMSSSSYSKELTRMVREFENQEPHVKVHLYNPLGSGNYTMLEKLVVSGFFKEDYPDLVQCYPDNVTKYIAQGYAVNVNEYIHNEEYGINDIDDYISSFMEEGMGYQIEGTYSLPFCKSTELMYYNSDVLLGLDLSNVDNDINKGQPLDEDYLSNLTWEELFDKLCPAIMEYNDNLGDDEKILINDHITTGIVTYDSDENFFITLAKQYGYGYTSIDEDGKGSIDFDNEGMKNLIKKLKDAREKNYLQTRGSFHNDYVSNLFVGKKSLFTISSTAGLTYNFDFDNPFGVKVAKLPHAENKEYASINQGPSVCILDHKDENRSLASFLLWKYITNTDNASSWALETGYMGIRHSSYESIKYQEAITINDDSSLYEIAKAENLKKISDVNESMFNTLVFRGSSNARTNVGKLLKDCLLSEDIDNEIDDLFTSYAEDARRYIK